MTQLLHQIPLQTETFEKAGYLVIDFLDKAEIQFVLNLYQQKSSGLTTGFAPSIMSADVDYRKFINVKTKELLGRKITTLFPDYRLCFWNFVVKKAARTDSQVQMHQDWSFTDESRFQSLGIWCPLIDVQPFNGCLHLVPGSHHLNTQPRGGLNEFPYRHLLPVIEEKYLTALPMKAGQAVVYNTRLFHCSPPNQSDTERVVLAGLMIPKVSPLRYYHWDHHQYPNQLEIFEVEDDFYTKIMFYENAILGQKPKGLKSLGFIDKGFEPLTAEDLAFKLPKAI
ncbi:MAG: phytanoyl-CoA dioxygenase family protein [Snowella sp.]|nr:phytanoyl-CoA dioxygenase family protein [Snowella sp.]